MDTSEFAVIELPEAEVLDFYYRMANLTGVLNCHIADKERLFLVHSTICLFKGYRILDADSRTYLLQNQFTMALINAYKKTLLEKNIVYEYADPDSMKVRKPVYIGINDRLIKPFIITDGFAMPKSITYAFKLRPKN